MLKFKDCQCKAQKSEILFKKLNLKIKWGYYINTKWKNIK